MYDPNGERRHQEAKDYYFESQGVRTGSLSSGAFTGRAIWESNQRPLGTGHDGGLIIALPVTLYWLFTYAVQITGSVEGAVAAIVGAVLGLLVLRRLLDRSPLLRAIARIALFALVAVGFWHLGQWVDARYGQRAFEIYSLIAWGYLGLFIVNWLSQLVFGDKFLGKVILLAAYGGLIFGVGRAVF